MHRVSCRVLASAGAALLLAACASSPVPPPPQSPQGKGGGYYLDDGPGDSPPDLAAIPDAVPRLEPLHKYANRPYTALGQSFTPMTELAPYRARGIGSWYGKRYHGSKTSTGEVYDMYSMTAAHPTLPLPSYARVTNPANGRSVVVRVNDRGPFRKDRLIDLSFAAAWKLGYIEQGSAYVDVEAIMPEGYSRYAAAEPVAAEAVEVVAAIPADPLPAGEPAFRPSGARPARPPAPQPAEPAAVAAIASGNWVQLGAYATEASAEQARQRVGGAHAELAGRLQVHAGGGWFRLQAGPYDGATATRLVAELDGVMGMKPFVVKR